VYWIFSLVYVCCFCPCSGCNLTSSNSLTIAKLTKQKKNPKKSTGREEQTNKKQNKQTHKKTPGSGTIEFHS
jgi:hypothetical protein